MHHRLINQKLSEILQDDEMDISLPGRNLQELDPSEIIVSVRQDKPSHSRAKKDLPANRGRNIERKTSHTRGSASRIAAVWNPDWDTGQPHFTRDENEDQETGSAETPNDSESYEDLLDEDDDDAFREPIRSSLKNTSSINLARRRRSKVEFQKNPQYFKTKPFKNSEDNNIAEEDDKIVYPIKEKGCDEDSSLSLPLPQFPDSVTDIDTYRRYLSRSSDTGGDCGNKSSGEKTNKAQILVTRRTMALSQAIMSLALLAISASQLRFVIAYENAHAFPTLNYFLLAICISTEIIVGIGYVILARFQFNEALVDKLHTYLIFALFFVALATIIMSSFSLENHVCEAFIINRNSKEAAVEQAAVPTVNVNM